VKYGHTTSAHTAYTRTRRSRCQNCLYTPVLSSWKELALSVHHSTATVQCVANKGLYNIELYVLNIFFLSSLTYMYIQYNFEFIKKTTYQIITNH